MMFDVHSVMML